MRVALKYLVAPLVYLALAIPTAALAMITTVYSSGLFEFLPTGIDDILFFMMFFGLSPVLGFLIYWGVARLLISRGNHLLGWRGHFLAAIPLYLFLVFLLSDMMVHGATPGYWIFGGLISPLLTMTGAILGDMKGSIQRTPYTVGSTL